MKQAMSVLGVVVCMLLTAAAFAGTPGETAIEGKYLEVRSCDVFTAACFANSEVGLTGGEAILAWQVERGTHKGVELDGLGIVAVVRASGTLGDTDATIYPAKSILYIDAKADEAQRDALEDLAREKAGRLLEDVIRTESVEIELATGSDGHAGFAELTAGNVVAIETRALNHHDMHCGNDAAFYGPLTRVENPVVAYTERDMFWGKGLGVRWDESGRRSAWLADISN